MTSSWIDEFPARIAELDRAHLRRRRRVVVPEGGARLQVDGRSLLAFCSNDYLGLAGHPALVQAACASAREFGIGSGASPLVSGHSAANEALEHELAAFTQLPRALYFYAGYAANIGIVPALVGEGDALFSDALNHACLIDGARLSRAHIHRYAHADLGALATALAQSPARRKLVITDAVFSMDGDIADVPALLTLCERHDALLLLDDAHGFGVLGPQGRGCLAHFGFTGGEASRRVLYMATLGKAAGVAGAFVAGDDALVEWLLQKTRSYIFATAPPPLLASALRASLRLIETGQSRRDHLQKLIARLRDGLLARLQGTPWRLGESSTAVQALVIGPNDEALAAMDGLQARGLWVPAIRPPTVPEGTARLRIALSAAHSEADVDRLVQALAELAPHRPPPRSTRHLTSIPGEPTMPANFEQPLTLRRAQRREAAAHAATSRWTVEEVQALFELPFPELLHRAQTVHHEHFDPTLIEFATLLSVKTGGCPEDCGYCPQSAKHDTGVEASKLMEPAEVLQAAQRAKDAGATRFCMGAAWRAPKDRDIHKVAELVSTVKALGLETCATLGMLEDGHAETLRDAGLDYYNHNLDSAPDFYGDIVTTRDYQDRLDTLGRVRGAGVKVCCGGIVGMGESRLQRAGLIAQLANLDPYPESVPINHLVRVAGTPLADQAPLDPFEFVRTIAVARITMPRARVRLSAGRQLMGDAVQALCFLAGANSIFYGDKLLTTGNPDTQADLDLLRRLDLRPGQPEPVVREAGN